jgi:hypothetical protein
VAGVQQAKGANEEEKGEDYRLVKMAQGNGRRQK